MPAVLPARSRPNAAPRPPAASARLRALADIVMRHVAPGGDVQSIVPRLLLGHRAQPTPKMHLSQFPCLAVVLQGTKTIEFGDQRHRYGAGSTLLVSRDLPIASCVVEATTTVPMLGIGLAIDTAALEAVLARVPMPPKPATDPAGVALTTADDDLLDALLRFVGLLDRPADIAALAPLLEQEVLYRALLGPHGPALIRIVHDAHRNDGIGRAIGWLRAHFRERLRIESLARHAGMSVSSLHHNFKAATALTPLQYQKHLRLHEARRLLKIDGLDAGEAGYRVGYQTHAQFSREYRRFYDVTPGADARSGPGRSNGPTRP